MNHQDATVRRLGVFLASVGFLTVLASLLLVLFQPGFPQLMRDARLLLSQILLDHGLAARIATVLPALATIGAGVALILGVDTIMDMARTSVNLLGNCLATAVVARWEGVDLSIAPPVIGDLPVVESPATN